jgi:3-(3-hydroxy-phenyl)propionate hydroxylase
MTGRSRTAVWKHVGATPHRGASRQTVPITIVGSGPIGLTLALALGLRGHSVLVLNRLDCIPAGSKAICFSKRSLDIFDRLGVADAMMAKGVTWNIAKVFRGAGDQPIYQFDLLAMKNQKRPAFINIQQYYVEDYLLGAVAGLPNVELRWGHSVEDVASRQSGATLSVHSAEGTYTVDTDWLIACDGVRSTVRKALGLDFEGRIFEDNFLIADVRMEGERPAERWFWFDPPFNPGQSALMHKQPDGVWRLDFQLGWNIDRKAAVNPENVEPLVRAMLGDDVAFREEWYSVYTFQCRRMSRFVHGRVVFAGDSAHVVSPFGARGCNGGLADVDNLAWKLDLIVRRQAPEALLQSYNDEAIAIADENILNSSRSTDFMTPKTPASRALRDAVLELASEHAFARPFVNSGRLSTAVSFPASGLNTPDETSWQAGVPPGSPALDAPLGDGWLLERLGGEFCLVSAAGAMPRRDLRNVDLGSFTSADLAIARYGLEQGGAYLIRPDQYVAGRWRNPDPAAIDAALARAKGHSG